jgi:hypothetical protein
VLSTYHECLSFLDYRGYLLTKQTSFNLTKAVKIDAHLDFKNSAMTNKIIARHKRPNGATLFRQLAALSTAKKTLIARQNQTLHSSSHPSNPT